MSKKRTQEIFVKIFKKECQDRDHCYFREKEIIYQY